MEEKNRSTLQTALRELRQYEAPDRIWDGIAKVLHQDQADREIAAAVRRLPTYQPPTAVWTSIDHSLTAAAEQPGRRRRLLILAAAASIALILTLFFQDNRSPAESVTLIAYEETYHHPPQPDWDQDEAAIIRVIEAFTQDVQAQNNEAYDRLLAAIEELNLAREELRTAIDRYGADEQLLHQLTDIERERTDIVKAMATVLSRRDAMI